MLVSKPSCPTVRLTVVLPLCGLLAACGGGTSSAPVGERAPDAGPVPEPGVELLKIDFGPVAPPMADGPVSSAQFRGTVFPFLVAGSRRSSFLGGEAGMGYLVVIDDDRVLIATPGGTPVVMSRTGPGSNVFTSDGTEGFELTDYGSLRYLKGLRPGFGTVDFAGLHGFHTPDDRLSGTASYDLTSVDFRIGEAFTGQNPTIGRLTADFGAGTVAARFDPVDILQGIDVLDLALAIDGTIVRGGFTGTLTGTAAYAFTSGAPVQNVEVRMSNSDVRGAFFGETGEAVGGIFSADVDFDVPPDPTLGFLRGPTVISGAFAGARQ